MSATFRCIPWPSLSFFVPAKFGADEATTVVEPMAISVGAVLFADAINLLPWQRAFAKLLPAGPPSFQGGGFDIKSGVLQGGTLTHPKAAGGIVAVLHDALHREEAHYVVKPWKAAGSGRSSQWFDVLGQ